MEDRKFVKIYLVIALLNIINLTAPSRVFGYEIQTHAAITKEAVEFYNDHFVQNKISESDARRIIDGAVTEDNAPRWLNHYYDPIHKKGLNYTFWGKDEWLASKDWARSPIAQIADLYNPVMMTTSGKLAMFTDPEMITATDYTWERAISDYASGDTERGLRGLGQVMHLVEDASVPDHTRNDIHIAIEGWGGLFGQGSPYELWTGQFDESNIDLAPFLYAKKPVAFDTLEEYFDALALYSNRNFYSKDTIDSPEFAEPKPDYFANINGFKYGFKKDAENGDYRLVKLKNNLENDFLSGDSENKLLIYHEGDNSIIRDYWERLAPKATQYAAGVINLFFKEVEKLKNDPNFKVEKPKSYLSQIIEALQDFLGEELDGGFENLADIDLNEEDFNINKKADIRSGAMPEIAVTDKRNEEKNIVLSLPEKDLLKDERIKEPNFRYPEGKMAPISQKPIASESDLSAGYVNSSAAPLVACQYDSALSGVGSRASLIINEVAWAGTDISATNEWIELRNISGASINVLSYQLRDKDDQIRLVLPAKTLNAGELMLLERTDDNSVPDIAADAIYVGALSNDNEALRLFDTNCGLLDEVVANPEWPAGGANPKRTMERLSDLGWRTYSGSGVNGIFGTPKSQNTEAVSSAFSGSYSQSNNQENIQNATSSQSESDQHLLSGVSLTNHLVISEISAGVDGNSEYEFVELYNPTDASIDMTGWSLKKKNSSGTESNLVSSGAFSGIISPKSFFLIAHPAYTGAVVSDLKYSASSQNIAYTNNSITIYDAANIKVDEVSWSDIAKGQSMERKVFSSNQCIGAGGSGAYLGNACDTDMNTDFENRSIPDPQNKNSLPEPRTKPVAVSDFRAVFDMNSMKGIFSWSTTTDATGSTSVTYLVEDSSVIGTTTLIAETPIAGLSKSILEVGREYLYSIYAQDRDGLRSDIVNASMSVPSFIKKISFFDNPINAREKLVNIYFEKYPFVPKVFLGYNSWKILTINLNVPAQKDRWLSTRNQFQPENRDTIPTLKYGFSGYASPRYSLVLPDDITRSCCGEVMNHAYDYSRIINDNLIQLRVATSTPLTSSDYLSVAYHDYVGGGAGIQTFDWLASDATKYYFNPAEVNIAPDPPGRLLVESFSTTTKKFVISWDRGHDPDGFNAWVEYQFNAVMVGTSSEAVFDEAKWVKPWLGVMDGNEPDHDKRLHTMYDALPEQTYVFGVRVIDELGATSTVAVTTPHSASLIDN